MTTFGHNNLNQLDAIGGSGGLKTVIVRGDTSEPASVKVKPGASSTSLGVRSLRQKRFFEVGSRNTTYFPDGSKRRL